MKNWVFFSALAHINNYHINNIYFKLFTFESNFVTQLRNSPMFLNYEFLNV